MSKTGNHIIDGDDGRDCRSPKHMGCGELPTHSKADGMGFRSQHFD